MSGTGPSTLTKAMQLRQKADSKHHAKNQEEFNSIHYILTTKAEEKANEGGYSAELYDNRLGNTGLLEQLKNVLQKDGFKVEGGVDHHYSEHAGETMWYIRISW